MHWHKSIILELQYLHTSTEWTLHIFWVQYLTLKTTRSQILQHISSLYINGLCYRDEVEDGANLNSWSNLLHPMQLGAVINNLVSATLFMLHYMFRWEEIFKTELELDQLLLPVHVEWLWFRVSVGVSGIGPLIGPWLWLCWRMCMVKS